MSADPKLVYEYLLFSGAKTVANFWSQTGNTLFPTTTSNRVLIGGATDDTSSSLQVAGATSLDGGLAKTDGSGNIAAATVACGNLTFNTAVYSDAGNTLQSSTTNSTELGYLGGATSSIQSQLNAKAGTPSVTNDNTTTVTFATDGTNQTRYDTTSSLATAITIALPAGAATSTVGQILRYVSNRAVTTVTVTGTVAAGPALTSFAAAGVAAWQAADTAGTWIRIQ